ncbi:MAG: PIG-L deacetylase family protein [Syntrophales bacterium]
MTTKGKKKILVVAAHPDDEVLGCGATIAKHSASGDEVHILILAEGITSRDAARDAQRRSGELSLLRKSAHRAKEILGASSVDMEDFPDNRLDSIDRLDMVKKIEGSLRTVEPEIVYSHHAGDLNIDHRVVHDAVAVACRPLPGSSIETVLFFEVPSSTEWQLNGSSHCFCPNWFVDISQTIERKLKAMRCYRSELHPWPHPRSLRAIRHLAHWRGASIGVPCAEAFMLGRKID